VLLGADSYTALAETSDQGYPVLQHIKRLVDHEIVWAPAIAGPLSSAPAAAISISISARTPRSAI